VDFSSASAAPEPSVAMQDSNVICLHQKDVGNSTCVLAVTGYGEGEEEEQQEDATNNSSSVDLLTDAAATVRGDRSWRDVTGGATVCCSQCCSHLGFASLESPETYRLLQHRLAIGSNTSTTTNRHRRLSSCASFLAREMVRYADSKAIFTFVVTLEEGSAKKQQPRNCILLRLVSWDTNMATTFIEESSSQRLHFQRVAKIVFEETHDKLANSSNNKNASDDPTTWEWGGVDLCCTPLNNKVGDDGPSDENNSTNGKVSTVRVYLQQDEYDEVLHSLREGSGLFSKAVAEATTLVKMGVASTGNEGLGLTAIPL
jgi:hypothetical protein